MISKTTAALQSRPSIVTEERCKDTTLISMVNQSPAKNCGLQVSNTDSQIMRVTVGNAQTELANLLIIPRTQNCVLRANNIGSQKGLAILVIAGYSSADFLASLRCLYCISRRSAEFTNCPVLSPDSFRISTDSASSCGTLTSNLFDFALTDFVAITGSLSIKCPTIIQRLFFISIIDVSDTCNYIVSDTSCLQCKKDNAPDCRSSAEASNHNHLSEVKDMAVIQHTQTHPKFTWRFMALSIHGLNVMHIEAATESEARQLSPAGCVMVFAGRLPVKGGPL